MEAFDVLIVGAGLSGIGAARHLQQYCPGKTFAILEGRSNIGGTWDLFRYPGVRSDSDMHTLGYAFKPWTHTKAIADGFSILRYVHEAAEEGGLGQHIRLKHRVQHASFSSDTGRWTVLVSMGTSGNTCQMACKFLIMCSGYYNYAQGYQPDYPGVDKFAGQLIHPQQWPDDLDYTGKRVVVIGSGATAVTLVPEMAKRALHVTMLQRSPTYVMAVPNDDPMAEAMKRWLPDATVYRFIRHRNIFVGGLIYRLCRRYPMAMRRFIVSQVRKQLGPHADMSHFSPAYHPWDQRLCVVPDGDLFASIRSGKAAVLTDHIESFTSGGIKLKSGRELHADIVVSATGLNLQLFGGMTLDVDGQAVKLNEHYHYKGLMFNDLPNLALSLGYTNASWTLKADLIAKYVCRLLNYMDEHGTDICVPRFKNGLSPKAAPILNMTSGYFQRAEQVLPKGANEAPWKLFNDYGKDKEQLLHGAVVDEVMVFLVSRQAGRYGKPSHHDQPTYKMA